MFISLTRTFNLEKMKRKIVIIGSGLGGLSCGVLLAKEGYDVTILEQSSQAGGCLQCFKRKGIKFETGMHFIGSADKGQTLFRLMKALEIDDKIQLSNVHLHIHLFRFRLCIRHRLFLTICCFLNCFFNCF